MLNENDYKYILEIFPEVEMCFSYGSGVFQQEGYDYNKQSSSLPVIDLILVVNDPIEWHRKNLEKNSSHYTSIFNTKSLINFIQGPNSSGVAIWFNLEVPLNLPNQPNRLMKYGVVKTSNFINDLVHWNYLYLAGRLHKPVTIFSDMNSEVYQVIQKAIYINRMSALKVAILSLPHQFSETDLYLTIAGLSYRGDPRMLFAENPNKVKNIVLPNIESFRLIYEPIIQDLSDLSTPTSALYSLTPISIASPSQSTTSSNSTNSTNPTNPITINQQLYYVPTKTLSQYNTQLVHSFELFEESLPPNFLKYINAFDRNYLYRHLLTGRVSYTDNTPIASINYSSINENNKLRNEIINNSLSNIIALPSIIQSLKGLLCVGAGKGSGYFLSKVLKRFGRK